MMIHNLNDGIEESRRCLCIPLVRKILTYLFQDVRKWNVDVVDFLRYCYVKTLYVFIWYPDFASVLPYSLIETSLLTLDLRDGADVGYKMNLFFLLMISRGNNQIVKNIANTENRERKKKWKLELSRYLLKWLVRGICLQEGKKHRLQKIAIAINLVIN